MSVPDAAAPRGPAHYRVRDEIARGGMGHILRARDTRLGREVAIKVLDGALLDSPEALRRFVEEAQIAGQLQHPGVVPVYEMGHMEDERPYFAMKLVKGSTFADVLKRRGAPDEDLSANLRTFESVCQTVAYAHSKGVIHRDLKPANVMVGSFGEVLVVDWGLAKVLAPSGEQQARPAAPERTVIETVRSGSGSSGTDSIVGSVMGTPAYMPPEQARGETDSLDERADVFALGAILCQILTGKPPYTGTEEERTVVLAAQAKQGPAHAGIEQAAAASTLKELCLECLCPSRVARPRDAGVVAGRMQAYFSGLAEEARSAQLAAAEARVRMAGERRARRLTLGLSAAVLVALVSVGGALWVSETGRERRAAALARTIDETRAQVLALHGAGRFDEALEVARTGLRVLGESDDADSVLLGRAAEVQTMAQQRVEAERERAELERRNTLLVESLEEVRARQIDAVFYGNDADLDVQFDAAFEAYGLDIDVEHGDVVRAVEVLRASGIASQIVAAIDDWAAVKRRVHGTRSFEPQVLTSLAMDLDPEGSSAETRRAILASDEAALLELAEHAPERGWRPQALWTLAFSIFDFQKLDVMYRLLDRSVRAHPDDFILQLATGVANRELLRQDRALQHFQAACALRPQSAYARIALGGTLYELGDLPSAVDALREAVRLDPDEPRIRVQLANALREIGDDEGALAAFDAALALQPGDVLLELDREALRFTSGRTSREDYLALLDGLGEIDPSELVPFGLALADHPDPAQRDARRALAIGEEILQAAPDNGRAWDIIARAAVELGEHQRVVDIFTGARARHRSTMLRAESDLLRARALHGVGRDAEARALLAEAERSISDLVLGREQEWQRSDLIRHEEETRAELGR